MTISLSLSEYQTQVAGQKVWIGRWEAFGEKTIEKTVLGFEQFMAVFVKSMLSNVFQFGVRRFSLINSLR
jgi:hypothetical protein